ncbi:MAG: LmbE family protein, partial [Pirellulales bacterium]|nr:LmbE family protein [Pirellulales bacterium]
AASVLGVVHREQLGFPNRKLFDCFEVRVALAKIFRRHRPRLVLGIGDKTPMASPDHAQAMAITEAAIFYSRLTKWDDVFDHLPVHTVPNLLSYFLFSGVADLPAGHWPIIVNIEGHVEQKLKAVRCYKSQFPPEKADVFIRVEAFSRTVGVLGGCIEGELLAGSRIPCTSDLMRLL